MSTLISKRIRLAVLVCTIAAFGGSAATFAQSNTWTRYGAEGFSILLPEPPNTMEVGLTTRMNERRRNARLFTAYNDGVAYVLLAFDNPNHRDPLSRFIEEIETYNTGAKAERLQRDLSGTGFTGKEYGFGSGSTIVGVVQFYLAADRVYMVEAIGDDGSKPSVKQFLDSFAIGSGDGSANMYVSPSIPQPSAVVLDEPAKTTPPKPDVFTGKEVTSKARVLVKPQPMYTEAAKQAGITGTVVLRGVFSSTGQLTSLRTLSGLPNGLTEQAIEAARNLKFIPASRGGRNVSMWIQLEYNFNLY